MKLYTKEETAVARELWAQALVSGEFAQGKNALVTIGPAPRYIERHCCLGVACEIAARHDIIQVREMRSPYFEEEHMLLPQPVQLWLGLTSAAAKMRDIRRVGSGKERVVCHTLSDFNDAGKRFTDIAALIRDNQIELIHDYV